MLGLIAAELHHRRGRALALLAGIAVATASFTVLTGASESSRLEIRGAVSQHFRTAYDVLVRPRGSMSALERTDGLVQQNFLAGTFGGITTDQLRAVRHAPGVEVAAPLAVYGYIMPTAVLPIGLGDHLDPGTRTAFRVKTRWTADRGSVVVRDPDSYVYVTRNTMLAAQPHVSGMPVRTRGSERFGSDADTRPICPTPSTAPSAFAPAARTWLWCWSTKSGLGSPDFGPQKVAGGPGARIAFPFPLLVAGIDPKAEAALSGANRAIVSGRYLEGDEPPAITGRGFPIKVAPVLAAATTDVDLRADVSVERLPTSAANAFVRARDDVAASRRAVAHAPGTPLLRRTISSADAYAALLGELRGPANFIEARWTAGPSRYAVEGPKRVRPLTAKTDRYAWGAGSSQSGTATGFVTAPATGRDQGFRRFDEHVVGGELSYAGDYRVVGTFDPRKLAGVLDPDVAPLNPFHPPGAPAVDPGAAAWLGGRDLAPDGNMAGYLMPPPALLTSLSSGGIFTDPKLYGHETADQAAAPISVIRVRVHGVTGADKASRERIRLTAETIARRTGLQVDVTAGSSPTPVTVDLPASRLGRPAVALREGWIKKGVATAVLTAVDRKSLVLFLLVLLVCALFCVNATSAAVRTRATELGVLACVGWRRRQLFSYLLIEVGLIGIAAGVAGTLVALPVGALLGLPVAGARAALAV
ncbi:MAG: transporter permease, partial [Conexibacter sp.]|nr:transporter permease [Conexibacter sp.]